MAEEDKPQTQENNETKTPTILQGVGGAIAQEIADQIKDIQKAWGKHNLPDYEQGKEAGDQSEEDRNKENKPVSEPWSTKYPSTCPIPAQESDTPEEEIER